MSTCARAVIWGSALALLGLPTSGCSAALDRALPVTHTAAFPPTAALPPTAPWPPAERPSALPTRTAQRDGAQSDGGGEADGQGLAQGDEPDYLPVDLPTVLRLARGQNLDVQIVSQRVREAHARYTQARQWYLPTLSVPVRFQHIDGNVQSTGGAIVDVDKRNAFAGAAVLLDWELGDAIFENLAAAQGLGARQASLQREREGAALAAAELYLILLEAQARTDIARSVVQMYGVLVEETDAKAATGKGFRGEVLRARALLARAQVGERQSTENERVAAARLREHLDLPASVSLRATEPQPVPLELVDATRSEADLTAEALRGRAEIREADAELGVAGARVRQATTGPWLPRVRVGYEGGGFGDEWDDLGRTGDLGVGLEWRVGPGGIGDRSRRNEMGARYRQSELAVRQVRQRIVREVSSARAQVQERGRAIELASLAVKESMEALELYRQRQDLGVGLPLDVIDAQETLRSARMDWVQVVVGYNLAQLRLLYATGRTP